MACETFVLRGSELEPHDGQPPAPLRRMLDTPVLAGLSVTVAGTIAPPASGSLARRVALDAGGQRRELVARGRRYWTTKGGSIVPSSPGEWETLTMDWGEAFGGGHEVRAKIDTTTGLPAPSHRARHPANPDGKGFYVDRDLAVGGEVPRLELLEQQLQRLGDYPFPGCFAPTPPGSALQAPYGSGTERPPPDELRLAHLTILSQHVAPCFLVLDQLGPAHEVRTFGMLRDSSFAIPYPSSAVVAKGRARGERTGARLRAVHVDADRRTVSLVWQHTVLGGARDLPDLILQPTNPPKGEAR